MGRTREFGNYKTGAEPDQMHTLPAEVGQVLSSPLPHTGPKVQRALGDLLTLLEDSDAKGYEVKVTWAKGLDEGNQFVTVKIWVIGRVKRLRRTTKRKLSEQFDSALGCKFGHDWQGNDVSGTLDTFRD